MTLFRVDADSKVSSLDEKRRERAGFDKLAVLETPDADLIAERDRMDEVWAKAAGQRVPLTEEEERQKFAREVDEVMGKLAGALKASDTEHLQHYRPRLQAVALYVDAIRSDLAGGGEAA